MASLFSRLFGTGGGDGAGAERSEGVDYNGFTIYAAPQKDGSNWRCAGFIAKDGDEGAREHQFIRADVFPTRDQAEDCALRKARQIIDERGEKVFDSRGH